MKDAIRFRDHTPSPVHDTPSLERRVSGEPQRTTWTHYVNPTAEFECGVWESEVGAWRTIFHQNKDEYFYLLEGRVRLTADGGVPHEVGPGEACVIPAGFVGIFEVLERVRKHYVIRDKAGL